MNAQVGDGFGNYMSVEDEPGFESTRAPGAVERVLQSVRNFATLSEALRLLGASVLLASMSVFLLQGWSEGNDIQRYLLLLTQTALLAAAGFAMSHALKEAKGARMFFGLALVSIPANFTILGALLYSVFQWDGALTDYPGFATWQVVDVANTGMTLAGAFAVLVPVAFFCFAVMARQSAKMLSIHFLALNMLLLLPIRSSLAAGTIALLGILYALRVVNAATGNDPALKTGEGKFALSVLFIPLGIILFRSMYFYQVDSLMLAMISLALFLSSRQASQFPGRSNRVAILLDTLSLPFALLTAASFSDAFNFVISDAMQAPFFATLYSAMAFDLMQRTGSRKLTKLIGVTMCLVVAWSFVFSVAIWPSAATAILSVVVGGGLTLVGAALRERIALLTGVLTILAGIWFGLDEILSLIVSSGWIELAIFGASAIAFASVLDRHGPAMKLRLEKRFAGIRMKKSEIALQD